MDYMHGYFLVLDKSAQSFPVNCQKQLCCKESALSLHLKKSSAGL